MTTHEARFNATAFPAQMRVAHPQQFPRFGAVAPVAGHFRIKKICHTLMRCGSCAVSGEVL
jgi:hypothetical protein